MRKRCSLAGGLAALLLLAGCAGKVELGGKTTVQVSASAATVRAEESVQLAASSSDGQPLTGVRWSVNGLPGGGSAVGTVDAAGKYTAPPAIPADNRITITAASDQGSGSVGLTLWNPVPVIASVSSRDTSAGLELTIRGDKFVSGARLNFGGTIYPTDFASRSEVRAAVPATAVTGSVEMAVSNPEPGAAFSATTMFTLSRPSRPSRGGTSNAAARFLTQASFGPTATEVAAINALRASLGTMQQAFSQYIDTQMNPAMTTPSTWTDWTTNNPVALPTNTSGQQLCTNFMNCAQILWMQNALQGPDQLRQRTAFALSQIWVVSGNTVQLSDGYLTYYKILNDRAFGNYKDIMREVTLSSAMGYFLDMGNSAKAADGGIANENYAREFLQLFTVGLYKLNDDGTFQLDGNGQRIPTYTEEDVQQFARALTGWTYARNSGSASWNQSFTNTAIGTTGTNRRAPMTPVESFHDTSPKTLLNYPGAPVVNLPGGNTAQQDLDAVLDNVFNHPNLPPFVSQLLIQHFTTSNPSPAYVGRVADVFRNNGQNVRGDMAAVIKAILLDPEARAGDIAAAKDEFGFLKEPAMYVVGIARSLGYNNTATSYTGPTGTVTNLGANLVTQARTMSQNVLLAPSVFNYYSPTYAIQSGTLYGPQFQLQTTANATTRANFADSVIRNGLSGGGGLDFSPSITALANVATNAQQLVDQLDQQFMYGQMSAAMKQTIVNRVAALPSATTTDRNFRVKTALYLTISSSQFQVVR